MSWVEKLLKALNDYTGATIILSAIGFGFSEWNKHRLLKRQRKDQLKAETIGAKTFDVEQALYQICTEFHNSADDSNANCIATQQKIVNYIVINDLLIREKVSKVGKKFADYILDYAAHGEKDIRKERSLLKEYKRKFRN